MFKNFPESVDIVEVGPRDGLQNEKSHIPTKAKIQFIKALAAAGLKRIEATSFVSPRAIPQLSDAKAVIDGLKGLPEDVELSVLVPNMKGLERALSVGIKDIAIFTAASKTFNQKNIGTDIEGSFKRFEEVMATAKAEGLNVRGYVSTVFVCPYEGVIAASVAKEVTERLLAEGCSEVSLGDTIGAATPKMVAESLEQILASCPVDKLALHFHDTRGTALANVMTGLGMGFRVFDSSAGGLGGCPYAPGAAGNLATEDLLYLLEGLGLKTGAQIDKVAAAALALESSLNHSLPGRTVATYRQSLDAS